MTLAPVDLNHGISPVPRFCQPQLPTARIFHEVRLAHSITRPELVKASGLSQPTVTRGIAALIDAGLITERPDLIFNTTGGRPRIPLTLANPPWFHIGFHLGLRTSRIAVFDVAGRAIRETDVPLALDSLTASDALSSLLDEAQRLHDGMPRLFRTAGIALAGHVDKHGRATCPAYDWQDAHVVGIVRDRLGVPTLAAPHVSAMAASELAATPLAGSAGTTGNRSGGTTDAKDRGKPGDGAGHGKTSPILDGANASSTPASLYIYAREVIGVAWTVGGTVHRPALSDGSIGHLPVAATELLDGTNLQETLGNSGVLRAAQKQGLNCVDMPTLLEAAALNPLARSLLDERARLLGVAIARIADIVGPAQVVLAGAAFTDDPVGLRQVARSVQEESIVPRQLLVSRARQHITRDAARAVAMDPLYFDPIALATGSH